jgi:hypothetical protein
MSGKGSHRRPCLISEDEFEKRWNETFKKRKKANDIIKNNIIPTFIEWHERDDSTFEKGNFVDSVDSD